MLQGESLVPRLNNPRAKGKEIAYTVVTRGDKLGKAIRSQKWRYARWPDGEELYDLENDPAEHENLADENEHTKILKAMRHRLQETERTAFRERNR